VAVVQLEGDGLHRREAAAVHGGQEEQPEVVAQVGIDRVVVDEVPKVIEHRAADAVEDVRRMPCHQRDAGLGQGVGGRPNRGDRLGRHVRPPVRAHQDRTLGAAHRPQQPARDAGAGQVGERDAGTVRARGERGWVVADADHRQALAGGAQGGRLPSGVLVRPGAHPRHAGGGQVGERVEQRIDPVVEGVVVGQRHAVHAQLGEHIRRGRRCPEEEGLGGIRPSPATVGDAAFEVQDEQVRLGGHLRHLRRHHRPPSIRQVLRDAPAQHRVAGQRDGQRHAGNP
jgi:hypothetical protein